MTATRDDLIARLHLIWDDQEQAYRSPTNGPWLTAPFRVLVAGAVDTARPIIEDGAATDEELTDLLPIAEAALELPGDVTMTDAQIAALARVAALGAEYMEVNDYASDSEFPEDQLLARAVEGMREDAFTYAIRDNFGRRWQDQP